MTQDKHDHLAIAFGSQQLLFGAAVSIIIWIDAELKLLSLPGHSD